MNISPNVFPSPDGITRLLVNVPPVSSQSSSERKNVVKDAIKAITRPIEIILTGDVKVEIAWYINEDERYETDRSADADNIIKPIVDALTGPDGIMINDCQVQSVLSYWLDRFGIPEHIEIEIRYEPDALFSRKNSLCFVDIKKGLCLPINRSLKPDQLRRFLDTYEKQLQTRDELLSLVSDQSEARGVLPIQRIFHISRCQGFPVHSINDFRKMLTP